MVNITKIKADKFIEAGFKSKKEAFERLKRFNSMVSKSEQIKGSDVTNAYGLFISLGGKFEYIEQIKKKVVKKVVKKTTPVKTDEYEYTYKVIYANWNNNSSVIISISLPKTILSTVQYNISDIIILNDFDKVKYLDLLLLEIKKKITFSNVIIVDNVFDLGFDPYRIGIYIVDKKISSSLKPKFAIKGLNKLVVNNKKYDTYHKFVSGFEDSGDNKCFQEFFTYRYGSKIPGFDDTTLNYFYEISYGDTKYKWTPEKIKDLCKAYKIPCYIMDFNENIIEKYTRSRTEQHKLPPLVGLVNSNHWNGIEDKKFIKSLVERNKGNQSNFKSDVENTKFKINIPIDDILPKDSLKQEFDEFVKDGLLPMVWKRAGIISKLQTKDKILYANPQKDRLIKDLPLINKLFNSNITFDNNPTSTTIFYKFFDNIDGIEKNVVNKHIRNNIFNKMKKGGINRCYTTPTNIKNTYQCDKNKAYTYNILNMLYDYPIITPDCQIELYDGELKQGLYFINCDYKLPFNGSGWYTYAYVKSLFDRDVKNFDIMYQCNTRVVIKKEILKEFVQKIIQLPNFKDYVNCFVGNLNKTT